MTTTPAPAPAETDNRTAAQRLEDLRAEAGRIELAELDDPLRAARDVAAWHARDDQRRRRRVEIEQQTRDLEQWGLIAITHPTTVSALLRAKPTGPAWDYVTRHGVWGELHLGRPSTPNPRQTVDAWLGALQRFAREVGDDENARRIITRELDQWFRARDGVMRAELEHQIGVTMPGPEFKSTGLPAFVRLGVYRTDQPIGPTDA